MNKAVIVIATEIPPGKNSLDVFQDNLSKVKAIFEGQENIKVYGAVHETAGAIVEVLEEGRN